MIIKIKAPMNSDGWFIYDNAEGVFFSRHQDALAFFRDSFGADSPINIEAFHEDNPNATSGSFFDLSDVVPQPLDVPYTPIEGWHITFRIGTRLCEFFGNTETYMLNDNGKTIERIF